MFGNVISWFASVFTVFASFSKTIGHWILNRLYLLFVPLIGVCKLIYDFVKQIINEMVLQVQNIAESSGMNGSIDLPELTSFVNAYLPLDTIFAVLTVLFSLWIGCLLLSAIIKIKQAVLF